MRVAILGSVLLLASGCESFERAGDRLSANRDEIAARGLDGLRDVAENPTIGNAAMELAEWLAYVASVAIGVGAPAIVLRNKRSNARKAAIESKLETVAETVEELTAKEPTS